SQPIAELGVQFRRRRGNDAQHRPSARKNDSGPSIQTIIFVIIGQASAKRFRPIKPAIIGRIMTDIDWFPIRLSFQVAAIATVIALASGVAIGYLLARTRVPGRELIDAIVTLPLVLPPTVLGYYLLVTLGARSPIGRAWEAVFGRPLTFTWQAAVVA